MQTHTGYFERFSLAGRVALVTGAAGGIGQSIAQHLGWAGARVVVNDLDPDRCTQTVALLGESGVEALACPYDVTQSHAVEQASALLAQEGWCRFTFNLSFLNLQMAPRTEAIFQKSHVS